MKNHNFVKLLPVHIFLIKINIKSLLFLLDLQVDCAAKVASYVKAAHPHSAGLELPPPAPV